MAGLGGLLTGIAGAIGASSVKDAAIQVAKFIAFKVILTALLVTGLAIVLNNFVIDFVTDFISQAATSLSDGTTFQSSVFQLQNIGAYLGNILMLKESMAVVISGISIGAVRKFIPFIG